MFSRPIIRRARQMPAKVASATALQQVFNPANTLVSQYSAGVWKSKLPGDGTERTVQPGRGYTFDGIAYIAFAHLTGAETVVSKSGTGTPSVAAGRLNCTAGTLWGVTLSDGTFLKCDEGTGAISYDSSANRRHGTITNPPGGFHTTFTNGTGAGYQNQLGYSVGGGGALIPRNEAVITQDATGGALQYSGRAPYNVTSVQSSCLQMNGTTHYISVPSLVGTETVVSNGGTATASIAAGRINSTAGTLYNVLLSNGSLYPISGGAGSNIYDVVNGVHGTAINAPTWTTQDVFHWHIEEGYQTGTNLLKYTVKLNEATGWSVSAGATLTANTVTFPNLLDYEGILQGISGLSSAKTYVAGAVLSGVAGQTVSLDWNLVSAARIKQITLSATPTLYTWLTASPATSYLQLRILRYPGETATSITVHAIQMNEGTAPDAWQPTGATDAIGARIPATAAGYIPNGGSDAVSNPAGIWHNGAETKLNLNPVGAPELVNAGITKDTLWTYGDTPGGKPYAVYRRVATNKESQLCTFSGALSAQDADDMTDYTTVVRS